MASILSQHEVYFRPHEPLLFLWRYLSSSVSWIFLVYSAQSLPLMNIVRRTLFIWRVALYRTISYPRRLVKHVASY